MVFSGVFHVKLNLSPLFMNVPRSHTHGQVDIIFLDSAEAFNSVTHECLLLKAQYLHVGIRNKCNTWLQSFLTGRSQCIVVNSSASAWLPVSSWVPQGTVLGRDLTGEKSDHGRNLSGDKGYSHLQRV